MSKSYEDSRFGVRKYVRFTKTASLAGTLATSTELERLRMFEAVSIQAWNVSLITGGTIAATAALVLNTSLAGTGALVPIGTATLATNANASVITGSVATTAMAAGDDLVLSQIGTTAAVHVAIPAVSYVEAFVNA